MAPIFRIHGLMKAIKKGNTITHRSNCRFNIVPRRSSSLWYFSNYHSKLSCDSLNYEFDVPFSEMINTQLSFTVLGYLCKQGLVPPDVSLCNTILDWFIGKDRTHEAERLFKKMFIINKNATADQLQLLSKPDIVTYNTMFKGLCKVGNNFSAIALLRLMDGRGCKPDIVSYNTLIDGLCSDPGVVNTIDDALKLLNEMVFIKGIRPDADTYKSLIFAFSKLGRWDEVCKMLKRMEVDENIKLDLKLLNIIIHALCKQNKLKDARGVFMYMRENGYYPNIATFNSFIQMFCSRGQMSAASETLDLLLEKKTTTGGGIKPDIVTYNTLIDGYMKEDLKEDLAIKMFCMMGKIDKVTHFLLSGLLIPRTNHHHHQSKSEYRDGIKSSYLYHLYMHGDSFDQALNLFNFMDERYEELNSNIQVYNILIYGANNCGRFDVARKLFHELTVKGLQPDKVTYTLLIHGFCEEGLFKDAKRMFVEMKRNSFLPDDDVVEMNELPLCYLEEPSFDYSACVSCDMSGIDYETDYSVPLYATLLTLNLPEQFLESPNQLTTRGTFVFLPREGIFVFLLSTLIICCFYHTAPQPPNLLTPTPPLHQHHHHHHRHQPPSTVTISHLPFFTMTLYQLKAHAIFPVTYDYQNRTEHNREDNFFGLENSVGTFYGVLRYVD